MHVHANNRLDKIYKIFYVRSDGTSKSVAGFPSYDPVDSVDSCAFAQMLALDFGFRSTLLARMCHIFIEH